MIKGTIENGKTNIKTSGTIPDLIFDIQTLVKAINDDLKDNEMVRFAFESTLKKSIDLAFEDEDGIKKFAEELEKERVEAMESLLKHIEELLGDEIKDEINVKSTEGDFVFRMPTNEE